MTIGRSGDQDYRCRRWLAVWALGALVATGCATEAAEPAKPAAKLLISGTFTIDVEGAVQTVSYADVLAEVHAVHKTAADAKSYACIAQLDVAMEKPDGSCRLELSFAPSSEGLRVTGGQFHVVRGITAGGAVVKTVPCGSGWPEASTKPLVYSVLEGQGGINLDPLPPGKGQLAVARLSDLNLSLTGKALFKKGFATKIAVDLSAIKLKGELDSTGDPKASCGAATFPTGVSYCAKAGAPPEGSTPGTALRRTVKLLTCQGEEPFDLGELCGNEAIWVIDWRDWSGSKLLTQIPQVLDLLPKRQIGIAVVVAEGKTKIVDKDPATGATTADGPAPTAAECQEIAKQAGLPPSVILLFDKDKQLIMQDKELVSAAFVPRMLFAKPDGKIVSVLPGQDGTAPTNDQIVAAIKAITGP